MQTPLLCQTQVENVKIVDKFWIWTIWICQMFTPLFEGLSWNAFRMSRTSYRKNICWGTTVHAYQSFGWVGLWWIWTVYSQSHINVELLSADCRLSYRRIWLDFRCLFLERSACMELFRRHFQKSFWLTLMLVLLTVNRLMIMVVTAMKNRTMKILGHCPNRCALV